LPPHPCFDFGTDGSGGNRATTGTGGGAGGGGGESGSTDVLAAATSAVAQRATVEKRQQNCESTKLFRRVQKKRSAAKKVAVAGLSADLSDTRVALAAENAASLAMLAELWRGDATITALLHAGCVRGALESITQRGAEGGVADAGCPGLPPPPPQPLASAVALVAAAAAAASAGSGGYVWTAPDHDANACGMPWPSPPCSRAAMRRHRRPRGGHLRWPEAAKPGRLPPAALQPTRGRQSDSRESPPLPSLPLKRLPHGAWWTAAATPSLSAPRCCCAPRTE